MRNEMKALHVFVFSSRKGWAVRVEPFHIYVKANTLRTCVEKLGNALKRVPRKELEGWFNEQMGTH